MITQQEDKLLIFENFQIDKNLPKFKNKKDIRDNLKFGSRSEMMDADEFQSMEIFEPRDFVFNNRASIAVDGNVVSMTGFEKNGLFNKISLFFCKTFL